MASAWDPAQNSLRDGMWPESCKMKDPFSTHAVLVKAFITTVESYYSYLCAYNNYFFNENRKRLEDIN